MCVCVRVCVCACVRVCVRACVRACVCVNQISSTFLIRIEYQIEYKYSVASNSIRILNDIDVLPGRSIIPWPRAQVRAGVIDIVAIRNDCFVYFLTEPLK